MDAGFTTDQGRGGTAQGQNHATSVRGRASLLVEETSSLGRSGISELLWLFLHDLCDPEGRPARDARWGPPDFTERRAL